MDITDYLTLSQAAEALGYARPDTLRQYCSHGRVPGAKKRGSMWLIPRVWVLSERDSPTLAPTGGRGSLRKSTS